MERDAIVDFQICHDIEAPTTMQTGLLLLFGLRGSSTVHTVHSRYTVRGSEVFLLSPLTLYRFSCPEDAAMLSAVLSADVLRMAGWTEGLAVNDLLPAERASDAAHNAVRQGLAALFRSRFHDDADSSETSERAIALAAAVRRGFAHAAADGTAASAENMARIESLLRLVQTHWREPLSLSHIASQQFLSESHLSRLFRRHVGMTFTDYLTRVRLEHAEEALRTGAHSVTQTAYENGFRSTNAFIEYFRRYYGVTPGQYRRAHAAEHAEKPEAMSAGDPAEWLQTLLQYDDDTPRVTGKAVPVRKISAVIDTAQPGVPLPQPWRRLVNIGYAHDGLIGTVQEQLRRAKQEIGFTDLRFHGIFDDDMHIYQQNEDGSPWYNFTYADLLFDFILSVGLTPYVELSFVPSQMARAPYRLFERCSIASTYRSREEWEALVQATVAHWIERYGLNAVLSWRFSILSYNYAEITSIPITTDEWMDMYCATYGILKELDPGLRLGGLGSFAETSLSENGRAVLRSLVERGCPPDFLTVQCYPHENIMRDAEFMHFTARQTSIPTVLSKDEDFTAHFLARYRALAEEAGLQDREIIVEECTSTLWQRDLSSDTCYKAAWMMKNMLKNSGRADMIGYWLLTDFIDEWQVPGGVFHGGYGLFTANGLPKAGYQALRLLTRAGERYFDSGEGWFVTAGHSEIQIFLYHYCHYDALYRYRYQKLTNPHDAYKVFKNNGELHLALTLTGLQPGIYRVERRRITRREGSVYDKWLEIGAPRTMRPADLQYLRETSQPSYEVTDCSTGETMQLESRLRPHEVEVIILQKRDC